MKAKQGLAVGLTGLIMLVGANFWQPTSAEGSNDYPYRDQPWCKSYQAGKCTAEYPDPWGFYKRECTSFVAWRLNHNNQTSFFNDGYHDASNWGNRAAQLGYRVDGIPAVGAVAWWSAGHVAWVSAVSGGQVTIEEYNFNFNHDYHVRTISSGSPTGYIHFKDLAAAQSKHSVAGDYDGNGTTDMVVWRPTNVGWWAYPPLQSVIWGKDEDIPIVADFDADHKIDHATWRPSDGRWYVYPSGGSPPQNPGWQWGWPEDVPVPGDYDADGGADRATWRPSDGVWRILAPGIPWIQWGNGAFGDIPVPADYDGDGRTELAVWRPGDVTWYIRYLDGRGDQIIQYGQSGDIPVPADYNGDGRADIATYRPSDGTWHFLLPGFADVQWGWPEDIPVPGDYNGDGRADLAVWRPSDGVWRILLPGVPWTQWGSAGDIPAVSTLNLRLLQRLGRRP